ncbi:cytochrome P450 4g15-like [Schistocerca gregaria]|uniref:cytochrome P450 4g15-like n=1 Tax=Schistocerca gregaria TaxID=7010 RepID=UPI00211F0BA7|nr:cytochrome P450 4g15-like [Schistocerca gregaria]
MNKANSSFNSRKALMDTLMESEIQMSDEEIYDEETLRLYPPAPNASVVLSEDTPLAGGRYVAPRGACVLVALHLLHRQPDVFPEPEKFDPSHFLENGGPARSPYAYLPFGAGAGKCGGVHFAMPEIKTVLAAVLRQFRVLPG